ncbi:hypothetical protein FH972_012580 [Carpinus fangiana]|uniref:Uncharacterized protein n=1 Tax=Carpinus fangiana TaxID=176857 RepID=A0A5N6R7D7_9ROSI|nr:hypothetical protein FH972_012580 [Carpinus fangiana]
MAITDHPEDNKAQQSSSSSSTFKADLDPSNPPGLISESAFNFVSRNSNLYKTESAEKQIHSIKAADEKEEEKKLVPNTGNGHYSRRGQSIQEVMDRYGFLGGFLG